MNEDATRWIILEEDFQLLQWRQEIGLNKLVS